MDWIKKSSKLTDGIPKEKIIESIIDGIERVIDKDLSDLNPELDEDAQFINDIFKTVITKIQQKYIFIY